MLRILEQKRQVLRFLKINLKEKKKKKVSFSFVYSMKGLMKAIMKSAVKNIHTLKENLIC